MPIISGSDYRSGILNLPVRIQLRELDSATGSYPTMARTGDPDFQGDYRVQFDDTNTVIFSGSVDVSYPTLLQPTGKYAQFITASLASPNSGSDLVTSGFVRKGVADDFVQINNRYAESIGPFKEHLRVTPNSGSYYLTGTNAGIFPGFSNRVSSKTIINIPLTVKTGSSVYFSTGTLPNALGTSGGVHSGLSYFNFQTGHWDVVGVDSNSTTGSLVDYLNPDISIRSGSFLCVQSDSVNAKSLSIPNEYRFNYQSIIGKPNSTFGFPNDAKFDPVSAQKLSLQNYLSSDFLIEKIQFVWTGSLGLKALSPTSAIAPHRVTFGVLALQNSGSVKASSFNKNSTVITGSNIESKMVGFNPTNDHRDVVASGRIQLLTPLDFDAAASSQLVELNIVRSFTPSTEGSVTGSFTLPLTAEQVGVIPSSSIAYSLLNKRRTAADTHQLTRWGGTRDSLEISDSTNGKSTRIFVGQRIISGVNATIGGANIDLSINDPNNTNLASPYLVNPDDHLVFYVANQPVFEDPESDYANKYRWDFAEGEHYVQIIGSQIRDSKEFHDTSNQPLTSPAIHEALHYDNPVIDQFQLEALTTYSGSYIDDVISGSFNDNTRAVVGSSAAGTQGVSGSLIRSIKLVDSAERYYDTVLPSVTSYVSDVAQVTAAPGGGNVNLVRLLSPQADYSALAPTVVTGTVAQKWRQSFPFEPRFSGLQRNISSKFDRSISDIPTLFLLNNTSSLQYILRNPPASLSVSQSFSSDSELQKFWFGFGKGYQSGSLSNPPVSQTFWPGMPRFNVLEDTFTNGTVLTFSGSGNIEGFKYGVKNTTPERSNALFRYDSYGNFRDMLEQRRDSIFSLENSTTESPIQIKFVSFDSSALVPATETSSSNKSNFATSSLPYFDGVARN